MQNIHKNNHQFDYPNNLLMHCVHQFLHLRKQLLQNIVISAKYHHFCKIFTIIVPLIIQIIFSCPLVLAPLQTIIAKYHNFSKIFIMKSIQIIVHALCPLVLAHLQIIFVKYHKFHHQCSQAVWGRLDMGRVLAQAARQDSEWVLYGDWTSLPPLPTPLHTSSFLSL